MRETTLPRYVHPSHGERKTPVALVVDSVTEMLICLWLVAHSHKEIALYISVRSL